MSKDFIKLLEDNSLENYLVENNLQTPTAVQQRVIPLIFQGKSLSILAQTGAGKTLTYALPWALKLKQLEKDPHFDAQKQAPVVIVLAPTRELAKQITGVFKQLAHHLKFRVRSSEGGTQFDYVEVLVTVPGQLAKLVTSKKINLENLKGLIFDEADQLLEPCFFKDLEVMMSKAPRDPSGQLKFNSYLFSATMPDDFGPWVSKLFKSHTFEEVVMPEAKTALFEVETFNIYVLAKEKMAMTCEFLKRQAKGAGIIFLNRKQDVDQLAKELVVQFPHKKIITLHGGMEAAHRRRQFNLFKKEGDILICTDIAARGIDKKEMNWVLNYDLPFEAVYYIHRAGRSGRDQSKINKGQVYNMVTPKDGELIARINLAIRSQTALKLTAIADRFAKDKKKNAPVKKAARPGQVTPVVKKVKRGPVKKKAGRKNLKRSPGFKRRSK